MANDYAVSVKKWTFYGILLHVFKQRDLINKEWLMDRFKQELVEILACPACKSRVEVWENYIVCVSKNCGLKFPIRNGIPVMLIEEAEKPNA